MCGIAGLFNFDGQPIDAQAFDSFVDALAHRGPDGRGVHLDSQRGVALGHRLLAIQAPAAQGAQPMQLGDRYWITFNGEIFNFVELRQQLQALGYAFRTTTDSEVLLTAYAQWGPDCLSRLNGMWAFAIWDRARDHLFLAVDRLAVKSLVYVARAQYFAFCSELKALPCLAHFQLEVDANESIRLLAGGVDGTAKTWMRDVLRLPAGHSLTIERGQAPRLQRWWQPLDHLAKMPRSLDEQAQALRELLASSVHLRLSGVVDIAVPISGGLDSSSVLATSLDGPGRVAPPCFFVRKQGALDEERFARSMARHAGATLEVLEHPARLSVDHMLAVARCYETFSIGSHGPLALYAAIKRSGASVSLDGHGGDELFGGYAPHVHAAMQDATRGVPSPLRMLDLARILRALAPQSEALGPFDDWKEARRQVRAALAKRFGRQQAAPEARDAANSRASILSELKKAGFDHLNSALYLDVHHGFMQRILRTFDYASMASGVEVRTPFLDWRLVAFALAVPSSHKIGGGYTKRVLREAMRGVVPQDVLWRRSKIGFIDNASYFFHDETVGWMADTIASRSFQESSLWNGKQLAEAFTRWKPRAATTPVTGKQLLNTAIAHYVLTSLRETGRQQEQRRRAGTSASLAA